MAGFHRPLRSATLLATALLAVALAGCGSSNSNDTSHTGAHGGGTHRPVTTSDADWKSVTDALGRTGKFGDSNTVYRIPLVRSDLQVVTVGVPIKPGLSLPEGDPGPAGRQHLPGHGAQPLIDRRTTPVLPALLGRR